MKPIKRPLVFILIGAIIGIIYGLYLKASIAITIFFIILLIVLLNFSKRTIFFILKRRKIFQVIFISMIISSFYTILLSNQYEKIYKKIQNENKYTATVLSEAKETEYYYSYNIKLKNKKFIMYVKKSEKCFLKYGEKICFTGEYNEPEESRNYKGFNYKEYLKTKKIYGSFKAENIEVIKENDVNILFKLSNNIRNKIITIAKEILPKETSNLIIGILIGEKDDVSEEVIESFSKSSLSHILAVSGTHISYIILGITLVLSKSKIPKKGIHIIIIILLIIFMFVTEFSPSVVRACIMGIVIIFAKIIYRKPDTLNSISLSLLIILIDNPFSIKDIGLQLSYLGTLGIVTLSKPISNVFNKYTSRKLANIFSVTISAQIMVLPITLLNFNSISTVFIISNTIAVPIAGAIILCGYANIVIGCISIKVAKIMAIFSHSIAQILIWIAEITSQIPYSNILVKTPSVSIVIAYYIMVYSMYKRKYAKYLIIVVCILIIIEIINCFPKELKIHFVDVGQRRLYFSIYKVRKECID